MKILIAYDGSVQSDLVFGDVVQAGLPREAEALIMTVGEPRMVLPAERNKSASKDAALRIAEKRLAYLSSLCPEWRVRAEGADGAPARSILERAREWGADLIALSALGHSAIARMLIGSVSYKVANEAHCSVRISRTKTREVSNSHVMVVGYDDQPAARKVIDCVAIRQWPHHTLVRLHTAVGFGYSELGRMILPDDGPRVEAVTSLAKRTLIEAGLGLEVSVVEDDPKVSLVAEAESTGADCIFIGDNDETAIDRLLLGTVASAVLSRVSCSVEIVR